MIWLLKGFVLAKREEFGLTAVLISLVFLLHKSVLPSRHTTSFQRRYDVVRRRIDVETTSCVYWVAILNYIRLFYTAWEVLCKKNCSENFAKFTGKHLVCKYILKNAPTQLLSCECCQIFQNCFFIGHL